MEKDLIKALLIEDDPDDLMFVQEQLSGPREGPREFSLVSAEKLEAGLKVLQEEPLDVILLDLMLPDSRGMETFLRLYAAAPETPIVILSGLQDEALALEAVRLGAQDFLVKQNLERRVLQFALRSAIERRRLAACYENAIRDSGDGMVVYEPSGTVLYVNPSAELILGTPAAELLGRAFPHAREPGGYPEVRLGERVLQMRVTETVWKKGPARLAVLREITELRRSERLRAELRERRKSDSMQERLTELFIAELRTPMSVIQTSLYCLERGLAGRLNDVQADLVKCLRDGLRRVEQVAANILDFSRLEGARGPVQETAEDMNLPALLDETTSGFRLLARERDIVVLVDPGGLGTVRADAAALREILHNLLDNAVHFARGRVEVRASIVATEVLALGRGDEPAAGAFAGGLKVAVEDDGPGIAPDELPELFEKMPSAYRPMGKGFYSGTGMGLFLCRRIVENAGGRIEVSSEIGKGARFSFYLPTYAAGSRAAA